MFIFPLPGQSKITILLKYNCHTSKYHATTIDFSLFADNVYMNCSSHSAKQAKQSLACFEFAPHISFSQCTKSSSLPLSNKYCPRSVFAVSKPSSSSLLPSVGPIPATAVHGFVPRGSDVKHWCFWLVVCAISINNCVTGIIDWTWKCQMICSIYISGLNWIRQGTVWIDVARW